MNSFQHVIAKLEAFSKRYYSKVLVKGILLFLTFGLLLFLLVTATEYLFWLSTTTRLVLFFGFLAILVGLGYQYVLVPILYLVKLKKGITEREASRLIGRHFPKVGDKLLNLLELSENSAKTDLLLAAIEQRSVELKPLPFGDAVNFREGFRYGRYLVIPILILGLVWVSGSIADFFNSYNRVVNYDVAYEPPAPFQFILRNGDLTVLEDTPLKIEVGTHGEVVPEAVFMEVGGERMLMQATGKGTHEFTLEPPLTNFTFRFSANEVDSRDYTVMVTKVPAIADFRVKVNYPNYLGLAEKEIRGTGNMTIPEGSRISWYLEGLNTTTIEFITKDTTESFDRTENEFLFSKRVFNTMDYELSTSNQEVSHYERLGYRLNVLKDAAPRIKVEQLLDSLRPNEIYFSGGASDDNMVDRIHLVYYEAGKPNEENRIELLRPNTNVAQFYYTFPSGIAIEEGKVYELYFEAVDNDGLRGGKRVKSQVFKTALLNDKELKDRDLENQESLIKGLDKSLEQLEEQSGVLMEMNLQQKQKDNLEYKERERIRQFLNKQQQQEELMEKFSRELRENLGKEEKDSEMNQLLQERLERQELEAKKNQKLLEELDRVADKIEKEELKKRLEDLAKSQSSGKRNLEQLLELTKRYYVTEKAAQLGEKLNELSEKQQTLSERKLEEGLSKKEQQKLNEAFEEISKELDELKGDNRALKKPMDLDFNKNQQESIKKDQREALEEINKQQGEENSGLSEEEKEQIQNKASQRQKSAAEKMKELSEKLQESMSGAAGGSSVVEDAEMLRQILDNLVTFSFKQENLLDKVNGSDVEIGEFSTTVRKQKELRQLFEHVDDSLFALSLRRAELSEFVNEQITEVYYNVDKTLESVAENQIYQAASYQQYVLNASNSLADFLADILDNMQQSMMSGQGQGQGEGFQLPDIIKSQGELQEKMNGSQGSEKGEQNGEGNEGEQSGEGQKEGSSKEGGNEGKQGEGESEGEEQIGKQGRENEGKGKGNGYGESDGSGNNGLSEEQLKEIYEIYQEQQTIRRTLEEQLQNIIDGDKRDLAKKLTIQMEQFEDALLENGITERTLNRMNQIQHQLLKLENAALKQGEKKERESNTNKKDYSTPILTKPELLSPRNNEIEILNRQALPLRPDFQNKVKEYFGNGNPL
ncbi:hypothetical protein FGF1_19660 [Flavobacteriaceae bacterium GF1]